MPLLWLSLAFIIGILLAAFLPLPIFAWILIAIASIIFLLHPIYRLWICIIPASLSIFTQKLRIPGLLFYPLLVIFISLGAVRYLLAQPVVNPTFIAYYNDQPGAAIVDGVLVEPPDRRDTYTNLRLRVEQLIPVGADQSIPIHGLLLARISSDINFQYGDRIRLQGKIETPPENEDFSYREYLANHGIYSFMPYPSTILLRPGQGNHILSMLYAFRQRALDVVYRLYPDPEASLAAGILLGDQTGIPSQVLEAFRLTGTSHIIVISGFNIAIIAALFTILFTRLLGIRRGALASALGIILYTFLVGADPAVVRAAILGLLTLLALQVGRRQVGLNSLVFVAALMALFTPFVLWDVSFQLSFAATLGILLYAAPLMISFTKLLTRFMSPDKATQLTGPVSEYFLVTLAAILTTLPLMAFYFNRISLTALIANPLILPAQPPLMVLGGLSVLAGMIYQPLGQLFAWVAWPFIAYTIHVVEFFSSIPHGSLALGEIAIPLIILFYLVLFLITFMRSNLSSLVPYLTPAIPLTLLAAFTILIWNSAFYAPDRLLHVAVLEVGTGDAILIRSPGGRFVLINGGPSTVRLSDALGKRLPLLNRSLDWLVVADIDNEDLASLSGNVERFTPSNILWAGNNYGSRSTTDLWSELLNLSITTTRMHPGQILDLGSGATLRVQSVDAHGAVLLLAWDDFRLLLPCGMDFETLDSLQRDPAFRDISALLLPESGYAPLNPPGLISHLHPQLVLLGVSPGDRTGLPSAETMDALQGYSLLRTDLNGWIELTTDGEQLWVEVEKK